MGEVDREGQVEGTRAGEGEGDGPLPGVLRQTEVQRSGQVLKITQVQRETLGREELPGRPSHCLGEGGGRCWAQKDANRIGVQPPEVEVLLEGH